MIFSVIYFFLLFANNRVIATPAPQLNLLEDVPSATTLRKTNPNAGAGDECGYGKFGGGTWVHNCLEGWDIPEWYLSADSTLRCCIKTPCGENSVGFCTNANNGCIGNFEKDSKCPGYRLNVQCCIPIKLTSNVLNDGDAGEPNQAYIDEEKSDSEGAISLGQQTSNDINQQDQVS